MESVFKDMEEFCPDKSKLMFIKYEIDEVDIQANPKWGALKSLYEKTEQTKSTSHIPYLFAAMVNSILYQERIFFTMERKSFKENIYAKDKNFKKWKEKGKFKDTVWTDFKKWLKENKYVIIHNEGENGRSNDGKALLFELVHPDILKYLTIDRDKQYQETVEFINNPRTIKVPVGNDVGNDVGNQELSIKNKGISTSQDQSQDDYDFNLTMSLLFREEFGINERTDWSEINDQIDFLASYAVENIGIEDSTRRDFLNYLKELNNGKKFETKVNKYTGWSQKQFAELLADNFEKAVESYIYHAKKENKQLQIVEPQEIVKENRPTPRLTKEERKKKWQEAGQRETVNVLKADFANPALEALERQLLKAKDDDTRKMILQEIKMIRMVCYGN